MDELRDTLKQPLNNDNGHALREQLSVRASWQARVSLMYRQAEEELSHMKGKFFDPSLSSEDKRKNALEYAVREYQRKADELKDLSKILQDHISLGQSMLRSMESEIKAGVMQ